MEKKSKEVVRKSDWVVAKLDNLKIVGFVTRVSKNKEWADVKWTNNGITWQKRMPVKSLKIVTTIPILSESQNWKIDSQF